MKKALEIIIPFLFIALIVAFLVAYTDHRPVQLINSTTPYGPHMPEKKSVPYRAAAPKVPSTSVQIFERSPEVFAYAHGSVVVDGKIFIGMAASSGNPFATNQLFVFTNPNNLKEFRIISIPRKGDIGSMVYDEKHRAIYFTLSDRGSLDIYRIDPTTYFISTVISTTSIDIGQKPAITTDGEYIYGITYTNPAKIFKVGIYGTPFVVSEVGHITNGHSANIGIYSSSTELYFGGGEADLFEKVNASDLSSLGILNFPGCSMTDDMPFQKVDEDGGYVYLGCEKKPIAIRVKTDDMTAKEFALPGKSFGMYIFNNDLYNAAQDGNYDIFKNMDISSIKRYYVGQDIQLNELFVMDNVVLFTGWWGIKGLYSVKSADIALNLSGNNTSVNSN